MNSAILERKENIIKKPKTDFNFKAYALLAMVGGYFEAYAIINRDGLFANAQTSNFTYIWVSLCEKKFGDFFYHLLPLILYCIAIAIATLMPHIFRKLNWPKICITIEIISVVVLGLLPLDLPYRYAILPIFFATALQFQTFQSCNGYMSSTIFCTNNIRQCVSALSMYFLEKDKKYIRRSGFYLFNLTFFAVGVILVFVFSSIMGDRSIWICAAPLVASWFLV